MGAGESSGVEGTDRSVLIWVKGAVVGVLITALAVLRASAIASRVAGGEGDEAGVLITASDVLRAGIAASGVEGEGDEWTMPLVDATGVVCFTPKSN